MPYIQAKLSAKLDEEKKEKLQNLLTDVVASGFGKPKGFVMTEIEDSQDVYMGGSGISCLPLVTYTYILDKMKKGELRKVLLVGTGALMNPTMCNQHLSIPSISHALSLEVVK